MKLSEFMAAHDKTAADIARESKVAAPRLSMFLSGQNELSVKNISRIILATKGQVTFKDLVDEGRELREKRKRAKKAGTEAPSP